MTPLRILFLEDNSDDLELMKRQIEMAGIRFVSKHAFNKTTFLSELAEFIPDILLVDYNLPAFTGMDAFRILKNEAIDIPCILVTGSLSEQMAIDCLREGLDDFILKSSFRRLPAAINSALKKKQTEREKERIAQELENEILALNESLEQKITERTAQLQEINKDLESFASSVSHDLRSPLKIISGYSSILSKKYAADLEGEAQELLQGIKSCTKQMSQTMESLLNLSHLGQAAIARSSVNMGELAKSVISELNLANKELKVKIKLQNIPEARCDSVLVKQVWSNLVSNAVKYSRHKDNPVIEIGSCEINNEVVYFVKDNGAGFNMKYADKLFSPFQRLHSDSEFEGSGIGLTIVHRIITKHGGRIWAEGKEGEGATFYFAFTPVRTELRATAGARNS